jgi:hypothetical protein
MAVGTEESQILDPIVITKSVHVMEFKRDGLTIPDGAVAPFASR